MSDGFHPKSEFLRTVIARGYVHQCSDFAGLDEKAARGEVTAYVGYDCTAPSLHVGSLMALKTALSLSASSQRLDSLTVLPTVLECYPSGLVRLHSDLVGAVPHGRRVKPCLHLQ